MNRTSIGTLGAATAMFCLMSGPVLAGDDGDAKLVEVEKSLWTAWAKADAKPFEKHMAKDSIHMVPTGFTVGKEALVKEIGSGDCKVAGWSIGDVRVLRPADKVAILAYSATQDATCGGQPLSPRIHATSVYVKKDGEWKAASYSETPAVD